MDHLKFASVEEALQHLSDITKQNIKIAWEDESAEMIEVITKDIQKNDGLLLYLDKAGAFSLKDYRGKISDNLSDPALGATKSKKLKVTFPFPKDLLNEITQKINNIKDLNERSKIIDYVVTNKEFKEFHQAYPKGILKDDKGPYYRNKAKAGLLKRGLEKIKGEKGEEGEVDKGKREKEEATAKEKKDRLEEAVSVLRESVMEEVNDLTNNRAKTALRAFLRAPNNPAIQSHFLGEFDRGIKDNTIKTEELQEYVGILQRFSDIASEKYGDELPKFVDSIEKLMPKIEETVEKTETTTDPDTKDFRDKLKQTYKPGFLPTASKDNLINNIVNQWAKKKLK